MSLRTLVVLAAVVWWLGAAQRPPLITGGSVDGVPYSEHFNTAGASHEVDPALLAAVAKVESSYRPDAVSPAGAQGLMQFMPATARAMKVDPWNPASAIDGAARYLSNSHRIHKTWPLAIAAYNAGDPAVTRRGVSAAEAGYVENVLDTWQALAKTT